MEITWTISTSPRESILPDSWTWMEMCCTSALLDAEGDSKMRPPTSGHRGGGVQLWEWGRGVQIHRSFCFWIEVNPSVIQNNFFWSILQVTVPREEQLVLWPHCLWTPAHTCLPCPPPLGAPQDTAVVCCLYSRAVHGSVQQMPDTQQAIVGGGWVDGLEPEEWAGFEI